MSFAKTKIKQAFAAASTTYDGVATLQRTVGKELLDSVDLSQLTGTVLDLGCGTGFLTGELLAHGGHDTTLALDIAWAMLQATRHKLADPHRLHCICADAEQLPLAQHSIDSVCSNLALQWCINLSAVFADLKRVLKANGPLVFSTFGPNTLQELKAAWAAVDSHNHVNSFYGIAQLHPFLQGAGFKQIQLESKLYRSSYVSVWALMQELKHLGAHHVMAGRSDKITTKTAMQQMLDAYEKDPVTGQVSATFEIIYVLAKA